MYSPVPVQNKPDQNDSVYFAWSYESTKYWEAENKAQKVDVTFA